MKSLSNIFSKIINIIIILIVVPILFVGGVLLIDSIIHYDSIPGFFGWKPLIVYSGSMETAIYPGDLIFVKETHPNELKINDIIAYEADDSIITHRIVDIIHENGDIKFITKGDMNNSEDWKPINKEQIEGRYVTKISKVGDIILFLRSPEGLTASLSLLFLLVAFIIICEIINCIHTSENKIKNDESKKDIENISQDGEVKEEQKSETDV